MEVSRYSGTLLIFWLAVGCAGQIKYCTYTTCGRTDGAGVLRNMDKKSWTLPSRTLTVEIVPPGACEYEEVGFEARVCGRATYPLARCLRNNVSMLVRSAGCGAASVEVYVYCRLQLDSPANEHYHYTSIQ